MTEAGDVGIPLTEAQRREREYEWLGAVQAYEEALGAVPEQDAALKGDVQERSAFAAYKAARQAEDAEEFRRRIGEAITRYRGAKETYAKTRIPGGPPRIARCDAMLAYMGFWQTTELAEKRRFVREAWALTREALRGFQASEDAREFGTTYNQLAVTASIAYTFEEDFRTREDFVRGAMECGEEATRVLSSVGDPRELARANANVSAYLETFGRVFLDVGGGAETCYQKAKDSWRKAMELSEEAALLEESCYNLSGLSPYAFGTDEYLAALKKAETYARKAGDRRIIGGVLEQLAAHISWTRWAGEDQEAREALARKALEYAEGASGEFSRISFVSPVFWAEAWVGAPYAGYYGVRAYWEPDPRTKRELAEQALEAATAQFEAVGRSGYPELVGATHHQLGYILGELAKTETSPEKKRALLHKAIAHRKESIAIGERLFPFSYWDRGVDEDLLAEVEAELSEVSEEPETRQRMLEEAIRLRERGLENCRKSLAFSPEHELTLDALMGRWLYQLGSWSTRLSELRHDRQLLEAAARAFEDAAESYRAALQPSRCAESCWEAAQLYDTLEQFPKASEMFTRAAEHYREAAEKVPRLQEFYGEHALYMQAWSEIEQARHYHARQEPASSKGHYEKAAQLHKSTKSWSFLAANYSAWAKVEGAEDSSKREQSTEAIRAYDEAARLFQQSRESMQVELPRIADPDEKQMAIVLAQAAGQRQEYCKARIAVEEARLLDKSGDESTSAEKYGLAAKLFQQISERVESARDRKELQLHLALSKAWQAMVRAEGEAAADLYEEAAHLFDQAKDLSSGEKAKVLAMGHSRFCKALAAGTRFADTPDAALHTAATEHLESAAKYYLKAGQETASEYAKASKLLFDGYSQMDKASHEEDPERKAKLYAMAEKVLQASAASYEKADQPAKRVQVLRLLGKVREERELALSLTEVLRAPDIVSTTAVLSTPSPSHERAVGLDKFEHANIQTTLIARKRDLRVDEDLDLEIEFVNAGRGPAQLIKLERMIPEGFELVEKPEVCRVEDGHLNLKGRRLDPLKTEELRLVLKPKVQGRFTLEPRILYLDDEGEYKSHEPEPVAITVKELGISGWLRGPKKNP